MAFCSSQAVGQIGSTASYEPNELKKHFQTQASAYEMVVGGKQVPREKQPLMQWNNPIRKQEQGSLFVWTDGGRPAAIGSIFSYQYDGQIFCRHEMLSLADQRLVAQLNGNVVWAPNRSDLKWTAITDIPAPSNSARRRLTRMRAIARQFSGTITAPEGEVSKLTLKPQPVIRYQDAGKGILDGAIFSMAIATDPEIWLILEARKESGGATKWYFVPARSHYFELELQRNGRSVWKMPAEMDLQNTRAAQSPLHHEPFFVFHSPQAIPDPEELR